MANAERWRAPQVMSGRSELLCFGFCARELRLSWQGWVAAPMEAPPTAEASEPTAEGMGKLRSAPLYINAAAAVELVFVFQPFIGQAGDLDGA